MLAGLLPSIYEALKLDVHIDEIAKLASEFKNLQDRFRQAANVTSHLPFEDFRAEFNQLMDRMDSVRSGSITAPERYFKAAQKKIKSGDYDFGVDMTSGSEDG